MDIVSLLDSPLQPVSTRTVLEAGYQALKVAKVPSAHLDAEVLTAFALGLTRLELFLREKQPLSPGQVQKVAELIDKRTRLEPVAYILGHKEFYGLDFKVCPQVLIPRPETETLLDLARDCLGPDLAFSFADIGTGSGALGISLASIFPNSRGWLLDISLDALLIAQENARHHRVDARLGLACADLAASLPQASLDLVLANPPYLSTEELEASAPDVKGYEPHLALNGGEQGLEPLNRLLDQARSALRPGGLILVEIGWRQGDWAREALSTSAWGEVRVVRDLAGHERVLAARRTERG